jgi:hypothetical protein
MNILQQLTDCQYAELLFDGRCQTLSVDDAVLYGVTKRHDASQQQQQQPTTNIHYATIDHHGNRKNRSPASYGNGSGSHSGSRRRSRDGITSAGSLSGPGSSATLPHSSRCPYKVILFVKVSYTMKE